MCGCQAHYELVGCTCSCDHSGDRIRQWRARAEAAESALAAVKELADEWEQDYPSALASCNYLPDDWWRLLRDALATPTTTERSESDD